MSLQRRVMMARGKSAFELAQLATACLAEALRQYRQGDKEKTLTYAAACREWRECLKNKHDERN